MFQVIAEEARPITRRPYNRFGTLLPETTITLPAGRVVGNWPTETMADQHAAKMCRHYRQRFSVRLSDKTHEPRIYTQ